MTLTEAYSVIDEYDKRHGGAAPVIGIDLITMAEVFRKYMAPGVPESYDWYEDVPEGADV
jgi:hypothetical protein